MERCKRTIREFVIGIPPWGLECGEVDDKFKL
jgi:hypothetical protein